jgi:prepilin-type processing-associated H-X9-DG protein
MVWVAPPWVAVVSVTSGVALVLAMALCLTTWFGRDTTWVASGWLLVVAVAHQIAMFVLLSQQPRSASKRYRRAQIASAMAVVLFPIVVVHGVFTAAWEREAEVDRISQLKRIALALVMYQQDNDGCLPGWMKGPDGHIYHNVWDRQIEPYLGTKAALYDGLGRGIRSPSQSQPRNRILSYGLNGLLITVPKPVFDGNADWSRPKICRPDKNLSDPACIIVLAELATDKPMPGVYANPQTPFPSGGQMTRRYRNAMTQWIDIDPRNWVETSGPVNSYDERKWDDGRGVYRTRIGFQGGGNFAFIDGHVAHRRLSTTVSNCYISEETHHWVSEDEGKPIVLPGNNWDASKPSIKLNQWYPHWKQKGRR